MSNNNQIPVQNPNQEQNENENQDQVQKPDPEQTRHRNAMYWEKMKEIRNLTFWLHVVAGTLVTVEIQAVAQKIVEGLAPAPVVAKTVENVASVHLTDFIDPFFMVFEVLYAWFMFSAALSPPDSSNFEVILIMLLNGAFSYNYIFPIDDDRAHKVLIVWIVFAALLFLFSGEVTFNQLSDVGGAIKRIILWKHIWTAIDLGWGYICLFFLYINYKFWVCFGGGD
ncbi:hypothetical protein MtrunA17_Chr8g0336211 [Medicago truncatula]|uniref:Transmembrane protein, putative n=1 Tax=Medicago truncatula TaxID=3880 RepID=A0A072TKJ5_MEDTR|nr:transmembrane protein, putative [Medicago truncatula]RHN38717.1 hypothetical protein MtrunA17_Chr8g0336211 [Medicago truncatula]